MTYIIGEVGGNWNADLDLAFRMVEAASLAGVDCVKFQVYQTDLLVNADDIRDFCRKCELSPHDIAALMRICKDNGVDFLASAFDAPSLELLADFGLERLKIPSGQIHNYEYLKRASELFAHKTAYMSTGMAVKDEWRGAFSALTRRLENDVGCNVVPMHCVSGYPVPLEQAHMEGAKEIFCFSPRWGYSDHTMCNTAAIMAVAMGADVIEHHFFLEHINTPDMPVSFDIQQLTSYVQSIRDAEIAMGQGCHKFIQPCEKSTLKRRDFKKSLEI